MNDWQPSATFSNVKSRAKLLHSVREFFAERDVVEVETPLLGNATVTDVYLKSFEVTGSKAGSLYLQTSPEYAMKRLLASGVGPIFQICKSFRLEESSKLHNPEFTMLEWYRPGFSMPDLMAEVQALLQRVLRCAEIPRLNYQSLFEEHLQINPHTVSSDKLRNRVSDHIDTDVASLSDTDCLQLLMSQVIEPKLPEFCFVYGYPAAQAALARIETDARGVPTAQRFELYGKGMELANGYYELTDPAEQGRRFQQDQAQREALGLPKIEEDKRLLAALESGLPDCAGVALGIDRLLMLQLGAASIDEVLSFPITKA